MKPILILSAVLFAFMTFAACNDDKVVNLGGKYNYLDIESNDDSIELQLTQIVDKEQNIWQ